MCLVQVIKMQLPPAGSLMEEDDVFLSQIPKVKFGLRRRLTAGEGGELV